MTLSHARTPRWLSAAIALPLMAALLAGCGDDDDSSTGDAATTEAGGDATETGGDAEAAEAVTIEIVSTSDGFDPSTISVAVGSEVTWTNSDDTVHTTTADDATWDSEQLDGGEKFTFTAEEPGSYPYVCDIHPSMVGELVVE